MTEPVPATPESLAEANRTLPRKLVAAKVLLRDRDGRVLLVDPAYKDGWDLPGGMVEANEPPDAAAVREVREELGLDITPKMLVVDWVSPHGPWDDQLGFVFDGGVLDEQTAAGVKPVDEELAGVEFVPQGEALHRLGEELRGRLAAALAAVEDGWPRYLRDGAKPSA